jgi:hypothetical protein
VLADLIPRRCTDPCDIAADLASAGIALLTGVSPPSRLLSLAEAIGTVVHHRDSGPNGVTVIEDHGARAAGLAGFSRQSLAPHTDRSSIEHPPGLILTACGQESTVGGEALLADGKAVYDDLAVSSPEALQALCLPRSVLFGGADGHLASVFAHRSDIVSVRLRTDDLARFAPTVTPHLPTLQAAIRRHLLVVPLRTGDGYVINNHRWLHGRHGFQGHRVLYRITADAHPGVTPLGFRPHTTAVRTERRMTRRTRYTRYTESITLGELISFYLTRWRTHRYLRRRRRRG